MTEIPLRVSGVEIITAQVRQFTLIGDRLPAHAPGAHLVLRLGEHARAYSLTDDGIRPDAYRISVRRTGTGGCADFLHDSVRVGAELTATVPRSAFAPVATARQHLLLAAGIGITPILSHLRAAVRWGHQVRVVYGHGGNPAHLDAVRDLAGPRLLEARGRDALTAAIDHEMRDQPVGTHAYACGPPGMLTAVRSAMIAAGWPSGRLHTERFDAPDLDAGRPFRVRLRADGRRLTVPAGVSLLDVLDAAGIALPRLCRRGVCGQCVVPVTSGLPEHRDLLLDGADPPVLDRMHACVSRSMGPDLEVDL